MSILIKPLVTEKFSAMNEHGKYGFGVERSANKLQIRQAVE
jgi:large subunit ribosomal protein L23